jgi:hypothetical protein
MLVNESYDVDNSRGIVDRKGDKNFVSYMALSASHNGEGILGLAAID